MMDDDLFTVLAHTTTLEKYFYLQLVPWSSRLPKELGTYQCWFASDLAPLPCFPIGSTTCELVKGDIIKLVQTNTFIAIRIQASVMNARLMLWPRIYLGAWSRCIVSV
jgi:hypothetical protein